ncbi:hypothetical protein [uncultured Streptomyces sp.]|uniref:hypothetical protein n=1 Tax=uncultured Streptomyces sp. TaxID=174707 RepID=UPI0026044D7F|nr:hypothetical protein [uncultured Streptomyces sp.]
MNDDERAAAQAYVRLLEASRAVLSDPADGRPPHLLLLNAPMREADSALDEAGLAGNEARFFALVRALRPSLTGRSGG